MIESFGYKIGKDGSVTRKNKKGFLKIQTQKPHGYKLVKLSLNKGVPIRYYLHRLLATKYIPNTLNKPCINHIDGDKANNDLCNLEWCTNSENMRHAYSSGLIKKEHKGPYKNSNMNEKQIVGIKLLLDSGIPPNYLCRIFKIKNSFISSIKSGVAWSWLNKDKYGEYVSEGEFFGSKAWVLDHKRRVDVLRLKNKALVRFLIDSGMNCNEVGTKLNLSSKYVYEVNRKHKFLNSNNFHRYLS